MREKKSEISQLLSLKSEVHKEYFPLVFGSIAFALCHSHSFWISFHKFLANTITMFGEDIMVKQFHVSVIGPQDIRPKMKVFVPVCLSKVQSVCFLCVSVGRMASSSLDFQSVSVQNTFNYG